MNRTKVKPYWYIKEDLHEEEQWRRQNRRIRMRFHSKYEYIRFVREGTFVFSHRLFLGRYKQFDDWNKLVKTVK